MNRQRRKFLILLSIAFMLHGCNINVANNSISTIEPIEATNSIMQAIAVTGTNTESAMEKCWEPEWEMVWANNYELSSMAEGPYDVFWFLTSSTLERVSINNQSYKRFDLNDMISCENSSNMVNGHIVISNEGEAWIGVSTGLLIIDENGEWSHIAGNEILPSLKKDQYWRVLFTDKNANIWISNRDNLCSFDRETWICYHIDGVWETYEVDGKQYDSPFNGIVSAVSGFEQQIWFGTINGQIILYDGYTFQTIDLKEELNIQSPSIGSLAYNEQNSTLWAVNTRVDFPGDGSDRIAGVMKMTFDGNWEIFEKNFFINEDDFPYYPLSSIAIMNDGTVWVGMIYGLGLAKYNGTEWKTINGTVLPLPNMYDKLRIKSNCNWPDNHVTAILATHSGHLLIGNEVFTFINLESLN